MARDYSIHDDWVTYVPEFDDNRFDSDPITVEIKPLLVREARKNAERVTAERVKGFRNRIRTNQAELSTEILTAHVRNIRGLSVNGTPVTTAGELLETNLLDLVTEIEEAINDISTLSEGDVKNFRSPSAGSPATAGNVTGAPQNSAKPGTAAANIGTADHQSPS